MPPPPTEQQFADTVVVEPIRFDTPPPVTLEDNFPEDTDDWDATKMAPRASRSRPWTLTLPDGTVEAVVTSVIVGRATTELDDWAGARLVNVADSTRSLSKNHAAFAEKFGMFVVEDLGSTNGILIIRADGAERAVPPFGRADVPDGSIVELGAVILRVDRPSATPQRF